MDVTFLLAERRKSSRFCIELGFFDSFLDVKKKIQKYRGISVNKQKLFLNYKLLKDDDTVINTNLIQDSCILIEAIQDSKSSTAKLRVFFPGYSSLCYELTICIDETVLHLKEMIHNKMNYIKVNDMSLMFGSSTSEPLLDHQSLRERGVSGFGVVYVFIKKPKMLQSTDYRGGGGGCSRMLNLYVTSLPLRLKGGKIKVRIRIDSFAKVSELKRVLDCHDDWDRRKDDPYFFIHKQYVMLENMSLEWHQVEDEDIIDFVGGYVQNIHR